MNVKEMKAVAESYARPIKDEMQRNSVREAFEAGARWAGKHLPTQWISVKEKLPKYGQTVLVHIPNMEEYYPNGITSTSRVEPQEQKPYVSYDRFGFTELIPSPDYWMPYPPLPASIIKSAKR